MIQVSQLSDGKITSFKVEGEPTVEELIDVIKTHFADVGEGIIWDFREGELSVFSTQEVKLIADHVTQYARHKKTAFVVSTDSQFDMLRVYEVYAEHLNVPPSMKTFRTMKDAITWLREPENTNIP